MRGPSRHVDPVQSLTRRGISLGGVLILLGSFLPLFKHSLLLGVSVWIWPWSLLSPDRSMEVAAATSTYSIGQDYVPFVLIPPLLGLLALFIAGSVPLKLRGTVASLLGALLLLLMLAGMSAQGEIYGLSFIPPTGAGGVLISVGVLAMACAAACNHLGKGQPRTPPLRIVSGISGVLLLLLFTFSLLGGQAAWGAWTVRLLNLVGIAYGVLILRMAFMAVPGKTLPRLASLVVRALTFAAPLACLVAQVSTGDPFTDFVVSGGGGIANVFFSIIRSATIYIGAGFLVAFGIVAALAARSVPGATPAGEKEFIR